jgi:hypothetical protein
MFRASVQNLDNLGGVLNAAKFLFLKLSSSKGDKASPTPYSLCCVFNKISHLCRTDGGLENCWLWIMDFDWQHRNTAGECTALGPGSTEPWKRCGSVTTTSVRRVKLGSVKVWLKLSLHEALLPSKHWQRRPSQTRIWGGGERRAICQPQLHTSVGPSGPSVFVAQRTACVAQCPLPPPPRNRSPALRPRPAL